MTEWGNFSTRAIGFIVATFVLAQGCGGGCGGGCLGGGNYTFPENRVQERIMKTRLTQAGIDFLKPRLKDLLKALLGVDQFGRARINLAPQRLGGIGDPGDFLNTQLYLQDDPNTPASGDAGWVAVDFSSLDLELVGGDPPRIRFSMRDALVDLDARVLADLEATLFGGDAACYVRGAVARGTPQQRAMLLDIDVDATLDVDANGNLQSSVDFPTLNIRDLQLNIDAAPRSDPECADGLLDGECAATCGAADFIGGVVTAIAELLDGVIRLLLGPIVEGFLNGTPLKIQGQLDLADLAGSLLPSLARAHPIGLLLQPGPNGFQIDGTGGSRGLNLELKGGLESSPTHPCVAPINPLPRFTPGPFPSLNGIDSQGQTYHVGLSLSDAFLNEGGVAAYTSGALCISLSSTDIHRASGGSFALDSGALGLLVPGLRELAGNNAPILLSIMPTQPPSFAFGSGELQGETRDSLIQMSLPGLTLSFYALIHDRFARLFEFSTDIRVGITVVVLPDSKLQIAVDQIEIDKLTELYNELFRTSDLQSAVRLLVDLATGALLGQGVDFDLDITQSLPGPLQGRLGIKVNEIFRDGANQDFLTLAITLVDPSQSSPMRFRARTFARVLPDRGPMRRVAAGRYQATGQIGLYLTGLGRQGDDSDLEFQLRLDKGPWSSFRAGRERTLKSPRLWAIGDHVLEVRARVRGRPETLDPEPVKLKFVVDPVPPRLVLKAGAERVQLEADDERTPREKITFSWRVGDGAWTRFAPAAAVSLRDLPGGDRLEVQARDEAGNISEPVSTRLDYSHGRTTDTGNDGCGGSGCNAGGASGAGLAILLLTALALLRRRGSRGLLLVLVMLSIGVGCGDSTGNTCTKDEDCPQGFRCRAEQCQLRGRCDAPVNPEICCPGQICSSAGTCVDVIPRCNTDGTCDGIGQVCSNAADGGAGDDGICTYRTCTSDGECGIGFSCFNGFCRAPTPCGGGCPAGEVCITPTDDCYPAPTQCAPQSCPGGQILVVDNVAAQVGSTCDLASATCSCADIPEIPAGDWGRDSNIAVLASGEPVVSAYDKTYGDLVLARYNSSGAFQSLEYVDGVPSGGTPVGRTTGRRGGITDPGPNVGRHTSVAIASDGQPIIAYYDVGNGDLKFAAWNASNSTWDLHTVDAQADVGRYAHLVVAPNGRPAIAYLQLRSSGGSEKVGLKFALAKSAAPRTAGDWDIGAVELVDPPQAPAEPCGGTCTSSQVCIRASGDGGADSCATPDSGPCTPACVTGQACVGGMCRAVVPEPPPDLDDLPEATGLFPSLAFSASGIPSIAYYDRIGGNLMGARASSGTPAGESDWQKVVVDGAPGTAVDGDVGLWPSLGFLPDGRMAIAYEDATNDDLVLYLGTDFTGGTREIIDAGGGALPLSLVGADAALAVAPSGEVFVAYQDATFQDLKLARRTGTNTWTLSVLLEQGAWGFFAGLVISQNKLYISNLKFGFDENAQPMNEVRVLIQTLP